MTAFPFDADATIAGIHDSMLLDIQDHIISSIGGCPSNPTFGDIVTEALLYQQDLDKHHQTPQATPAPPATPTSAPEIDIIYISDDDSDDDEEYDLPSLANIMARAAPKRSPISISKISSDIKRRRVVIGA